MILLVMVGIFPVFLYFCGLFDSKVFHLLVRGVSDLINGNQTIAFYKN